MSNTLHQYELRFGPKNTVFLGLVGLYFLSLFFEHPIFALYFSSIFDNK